MKKDIRQLSLEELETAVIELGEPKFRAKQIFEWIWKKKCVDFDSMTNLSMGFREKLNAQFVFHTMLVETSQRSSDGTYKLRFQLHDGHFIEGVLIPTEDRMTACVSSQVGCSLTCKFCATGYMARKRNLDPAEIYDQVVHINQLAEREYGMSLTNIVFMGMGEPLLNYANVLKGIEHLTSPSGLGMSPSRITVSTAGVAKMIRKLADDEVRFHLALSLHAANDEKRNTIMPINETNSLEVLEEALTYFYQKTKNKITFEYITFNNFNDGEQDAKELAKICRQFPAKVNIIEYNPIDQVDFTKSDSDRIDRFAIALRKLGIMVSVRRSRGKDIDAACGQLANKG
ncbi:MAG: 23S rRNA (adenine(2503)-C(2))-methyltransferase RlmN [Bacteroidia bacterium]|jgi:23S rRNA (adenine2503-C2)-methyltransferase